jgi:hypothetical protein
MAHNINNMTRLLNKIERRLGTRQLKLPDYLCKDEWANAVIIEDSLVTFSRYFPNKITIHVDNAKKKNGWFYIEDSICDSVEILGVKDIDWDEYTGRESPGAYGLYDVYSDAYGLDDIGLMQMRADHMSLFNRGIYIEFKEPNMFRLVSVNNMDLSHGLQNVPVQVLCVHSPSLCTISPTMMGVFEDLATADVASWLYEELKYYEALETVYVNIDLKLSDLQDKASRRAEVLDRLESAQVSGAQTNLPIIMTV